MKKHFLLLCLMCAGGLLSSGCQETKKALGFTKSVPDENTVMERAPLTVPDNLELRPPRTGDADAEYEATEKARQLLVGKTKQAKDKSTLEKDLLNKAGFGEANPEIRKELEKRPLKTDESDVLDSAKVKKNLDKKGKQVESDEREEELPPQES